MNSFCDEIVKNGDNFSVEEQEKGQQEKESLNEQKSFGRNGRVG